MACDGSTILVEKTNFQALNNVAKASLKLQPILIKEMNFDCGKQHKGGFNLHLLVFPFVYRFNYRIEALACSSFAND